MEGGRPADERPFIVLEYLEDHRGYKDGKYDAGDPVHDIVLLQKKSRQHHTNSEKNGTRCHRHPQQ
jgi:hypothetical protein